MNRQSRVPGNSRWTTLVAKPQTVHKSICWELTTRFKIRGYLTGSQDQAVRDLDFYLGLIHHWCMRIASWCAHSLPPSQKAAGEGKPVCGRSRRLPSEGKKAGRRALSSRKEVLAFPTLPKASNVSMGSVNEGAFWNPSHSPWPLC